VPHRGSLTDSPLQPPKTRRYARRRAPGRPYFAPSVGAGKAAPTDDPMHPNQPRSMNLRRPGAFLGQRLSIFRRSYRKLVQTPGRAITAVKNRAVRNFQQGSSRAGQAISHGLKRFRFGRGSFHGFSCCPGMSTYDGGRSPALAQGRKWDVSEALVESKRLTILIDTSVIITLLLHHDKDLPVPPNERRRRQGQGRSACTT
jgi:hypothetical protein